MKAKEYCTGILRENLTKHQNPHEIFHRLSIEELKIKSENSKSISLLVDLTINPRSSAFHYKSNLFTIHGLQFSLNFVSFPHNTFLEIYLNIYNTETHDKFYSFSFNLNVNSAKFQFLTTINLAYKKSLLLQRVTVIYPVSVVLEGRYEQYYSKLFAKVLSIPDIQIEETSGAIDSNRLELILHNSNFIVRNEDEVLIMIGAWCDFNYISDENLEIMLGLVRWRFITVKGLLTTLRFPVLKSSPVFKEVFKREMLFASGVSSRKTIDSPRNSYRRNKILQQPSEFLNNLAENLVDSNFVIFT